MTQVISRDIHNATVIDSRGPRFAAVLTSIVLATALVTHSAILIALQAIVFAIGAFKGPQFTPYAAIFRNWVKPLLNGKPELEDVRPPQFAQKVGLGFALVGFAGALLGSSALFTIAVGGALFAAFLNAAFNFCLGCEIYLISLRLRTR
jgi:hypothetical protein